MKPMKFKIKSIVVAAFLSTLLLSACNQDFVNTQPLNQASEGVVWSDGGLVEAFVTGIYGGLQQGGFAEEMLASTTDESMFTHPYDLLSMTESLVSASDLRWLNRDAFNGRWDKMYLRIRACNVALQHLASPEFENPPEDTGFIDRLKGEAYFLRAFYYHQLVRYYGGVPLIDSVYTLGQKDLTIARNTFAECVDHITADCDKAAALLKGKNIAKGRANEVAALALKSRILLYAASDLHDIPTAKSKSSVISAYDHPELIGYPSGNRTERWEKAKAAAKAVLDRTEYAYKMDLTAPVTPEEGTQNYMDISLAQNGGEAEIIFGRYFIDDKDEQGAWVGRNNGPNGYHNWAGNTPIQNLVDDYEMQDGTAFSWDKPEEATAPYKNRDPRFYASILYDGADWKPRPDVGVDPVNQIQTGTYEVIRSGQKVSVPGLDTRSSSIENWNGSYTGYYMRKFIDPNPDIVNQTDRQKVPWPFFRYTEAVFNYAEACIALHQDGEARDWLNKIRFRAGMPALTESGNALMTHYENERRIEMAYEEQRYSDARRWMIAPQTLGQKAQVIKITGKLKPGHTVTQYRHSEADYTYSYSAQNTDLEDRQWLDKMYFMPMSRDEMNRNNKLVQNPGY
ncbi:RagB/SusD family nutrient uptake outer membrane protein [Compostibacter hankyongensis]|uniref:RagB/SusD family nutrient uptake outer membrane protein n=1 Tax=Compostibacter hankyongensis TaxID=1007089 RepID=A0ABP8FN56_9BACT